MKISTVRHIMKISIVLLLLLFSSYHQILAQGASFGLKGGVNLSSISMETALFKPGFQVGGFTKLMFAKRFGLQAEALYSNQNSQIGEEMVSLNYFSIPILLRYNINSFINIQAGPQYTMLLDYMDPSESLGGTVRHKDICLALGIGIDMPMGFSASLRFLNGFNKPENGIGDISSEAVQLSVAFTLLDFRND